MDHAVIMAAASPRELSSKDMRSGRVLIDMDQLLKKIPLSARTIQEMEKKGEFPQRFAIAPRRVVWDLDEVDTWIIERKEAARKIAAPGFIPVAASTRR